ncbi:MAG: SDR family oxidoreductase [Pseudomonadota bacterium]
MNTVLITGANRGIGLELTKRYAANGAKVHACCRHPHDADDLKALDGDIAVHALDTADHAATDDLASTIDEPIDIVIANAGVMGKDSSDQSFSSLDLTNLRYTLEINTVGAVKTLQAFLPHVKRSQGKKLVAITSKMGSIDDATGGYIAYRASKTALNMALSCAAFELQNEGIAVGALHPGWVRTRMGGPNGTISVEESAEGLITVIEGLEPANKAPFLSYDGTDIAW